MGFLLYGCRTHATYRYEKKKQIVVVVSEKSKNLRTGMPRQGQFPIAANDP
jgi:hypothetical protein